MQCYQSDNASLKKLIIFDIVIMIPKFLRQVDLIPD